ncbi:leucyl aminopeptidase [Leifsonia sp. NCR5]|uniref:leucyl aminopeptidase n=1 Tax=Leifsonia sp. NCR5 TaxID=1978342 RepID=UPI000A199413|nr:leucyl aminopeptidase [Leifsonia sp. NCR5]
MTSSAYKLIPGSFTPVPSIVPERVVDFDAVSSFSSDLDAVGVTVGSDGDVDASIGLGRDALSRAGFDGKAGQTLLVPTGSAPLLYAIGTGDASGLDADALRDAAAAFARAASSSARVGLRLTDVGSVPAERVGQVAAEGVLLARYRFSELKREPKVTELTAVELLADGVDASGVTAGIPGGVVSARGANVARDLANTPPGHLTATDFGDLALSLAERFGIEVEVFDKQQLIELGTGGLLGVNAGSAEEPRMIKLRYTPNGEPTGHLAMVGKGIMYDSGGISLKPSDPMHLLMKMDMGGAAAIFGAFTSLRDLGCTTSVTAFLMCTDNMPSGSAYKLGDVLTARNGTTIEVKNTDAEGRLAMCDGLALAAEEKPDAIVDIATLTGAALMALGPIRAALFGNDQAFVDQATAAATATDERVWQLPLEKKYRKALDSDIADIANLGGPFAGATTAALFLNEFVDGVPWAHLDIAGTMNSETDDSWRSKGATGFGARLLTDLALGFRPVR